MNSNTHEPKHQFTNKKRNRSKAQNNSATSSKEPDFKATIYNQLSTLFNKVPIIPNLSEANKFHLVTLSFFDAESTISKESLVVARNQKIFAKTGIQYQLISQQLWKTHNGIRTSCQPIESNKDKVLCSFQDNDDVIEVKPYHGEFDVLYETKKAFAIDNFKCMTLFANTKATVIDKQSYLFFLIKQGMTVHKILNQIKHNYPFLLSLNMPIWLIGILSYKDDDRTSEYDNTTRVLQDEIKKECNGINILLLMKSNGKRKRKEGEEKKKLENKEEEKEEFSLNQSELVQNDIKELRANKGEMNQIKIITKNNNKRMETMNASFLNLPSIVPPELKKKPQSKQIK